MSRSVNIVAHFGQEMRLRVGKLMYDSAARLTRHLPHFRGKWQVVDFVSRAGLRFHGADDALRTVRMKDGSLMIWELRDITERRAAWLGMYDDFIRQAIVARLAPGAVILDVGANVGAWTIPLARQIGTSGTVCAFEPVPANLRRLEQAIALNALPNVEIADRSGRRFALRGHVAQVRADRGRFRYGCRRAGRHRPSDGNHVYTGRMGGKRWTPAPGFHQT